MRADHMGEVARLDQENQSLRRQLVDAAYIVRALGHDGRHGDPNHACTAGCHPCQFVRRWQPWLRAQATTEETAR